MGLKPDELAHGDRLVARGEDEVRTLVEDYRALAALNGRTQAVLLAGMRLGALPHDTACAMLATAVAMLSDVQS